MKRFFLTFLISTGSLALTAHLIEGIAFETVSDIAIAALLLGFVNATIRPILAFLTLPIRLLTLGLFSFVINAMMFWGVSLLITPGFRIDGPLPALVGSTLLTLISGGLNLVFNPKRKRR